MGERGLDSLERNNGHTALGNLAMPRLFELAAAVNRWRRLRASSSATSPP